MIGIYTEQNYERKSSKIRVVNFQVFQLKSFVCVTPTLDLFLNRMIIRFKEKQRNKTHLGPNVQQRLTKDTKTSHNVFRWCTQTGPSSRRTMRPASWTPMASPTTYCTLRTHTAPTKCRHCPFGGMVDLLPKTTTYCLKLFSYWMFVNFRSLAT